VPDDPTLSIALVGLPGSGKSTVGRQLARYLGLAAVDTDALIEQRVGMSVKDYFAAEGEARFRDQEQAVMAEVAAQPGLVISTGGGALLRAANREALRRPGMHVVYLRCAPEELARRLRQDSRRPLLQGGDALGKLREMARVRDPLYREVAEFVIDAGRGASANRLLNLVIMQLELAGFGPPPRPAT